MRILHTVAPARVGGLEEVVVQLATGLAGRGHQVRVAAVFSGEPGDHPFVEALRAGGIAVSVLAIPPRRYRAEAAGIRRLCEEWKPDVVHTHGYRPDVLHRAPARRAGVPLVSTLHGFTGGGWKNRLYERLQLRSVRRFDAVVAVSRPMAEGLQARGFQPEWIHLIPNAWSPRRGGAGGQAAVQAAIQAGVQSARSELDIQPDRLHIGWVGRLSREKGPDVFLESLAQLGGPGDQHVVASIIGDGPLRTELERTAGRVRSAGVEVHFHGALPGAARLFSAFDLFVMSSRTEGTPIVLFEAMAAGVPVVATAVGGVPDVVGPGEALLVDSEQPEALASAIRRVIRDPVAARERAGRARERLERTFAAEPWLERHEALYASIMGARDTVHRKGGG